MVDPGVPLRHRAPVHYPVATNVTGTVVIEAKVNADGIVTGASVKSGPEALRNAAKSSVLDWHYPKGVPSKIAATITFADAIWIPAPPPYQPPPLGPPITIRVPISQSPPPSPRAGGTFTIRNVRYSGLPAELEEEVRERLHLGSGEPLTFKEDDLRGTLQKIDRHYDIAILKATSAPELLVMTIPQDVENLCNALGLQAPDPTKSPSKPAVIRRSPPVYPMAAKQDRVQGTVNVMTVIDPNGYVQEAIAMSGPLPLRRSAEDAVKQWIFAPDAALRVVVTDVSYALN